MGWAGSGMGEARRPRLGGPCPKRPGLAKPQIFRGIEGYYSTIEAHSVLFLFGKKHRVTVGTSILALGQNFLAALKSVKQG